MLTTISKLSDKAMLVKLTIRRAALTRRDTYLTGKIQAQEGDASLTVLTKLFRDKQSPINTIMTAVNEVYAYHKTHTLPYVDAGPRILPSNNYMDYTSNMKTLIARVDSLLATYMPHYDVLVQDDITFRNSGSAQGRATASDYPEAHKFAEAMGVEFRFSPMPDSRHFLFDLSDEDMAAFDKAEQEAAAAANADTVARMLKPLHSLVERLNEYKGEKGERFHNSLIQNVIEGCDIAAKLALYPTPELNDEINTLRQAAKNCLDSVEVLKGSAHARDAARAKLAAVANRMAAFG